MSPAPSSPSGVGLGRLDPWRLIRWIAGWVIRYGALTSAAVGLVCIGNILYWRRLEETALESRYGTDHLSYRRRTWF